MTPPQTADSTKVTQLDRFLQGVDILRTATDSNYPLAANVDVIYFEADAERLTPKQIADLKLLGWHLEEDGGFRMFV